MRVHAAYPLPEDRGWATATKGEEPDLVFVYESAETRARPKKRKELPSIELWGTPATPDEERKDRGDGSLGAQAARTSPSTA